MTDTQMSRHDHILANLVFSFQAAAMQQLGKIQNPLTGEVDKDLEQAKSTIDVLEMLKVKCRTDTPEDLLRLLDQAVMDLQLNYMDEVKKAAGQSTEAPETETTEADDQAAGKTDETAEETSEPTDSKDASGEAAE